MKPLAYLIRSRGKGGNRMKYYERCGDCGGDITERKVSKRLSICDDCWERRGWIVANMNRIVEWFGLKEFQALQSVMAHKTGTAKRRIVKMMKEFSAVEERG